MRAQPAQRPTGDATGRLSDELEAVATLTTDDGPAPQPRTLAQAHALDNDQREAWMRTTPAKDRWQALQAGRRPPVDHEWTERAACAGADADLVELTSQEAAREYAATLCARCPVLAWCATDAAQHDAYGLWAGVLLRHGSPAREHGAGHAKLAEAAEWLAGHLRKQGPQLAPEVALAAGAFGVTRYTLNAAADHLGIERRRGVAWELPGSDRSPQQATEQEQQEPAPAGRPQRHRRQRTQPRRAKPRSRRGRRR